jgi:hypothetical protein
MLDLDPVSNELVRIWNPEINLGDITPYLTFAAAGRRGACSATAERLPHLLSREPVNPRPLAYQTGGPPGAQVRKSART